MSPRLNRVVLYFNKGGGGAHNWLEKAQECTQRGHENADYSQHKHASDPAINDMNQLDDVFDPAIKSTADDRNKQQNQRDADILARARNQLFHTHSLTADKPGRCSGMGLGLGLVVLASDVDGKPNHHDNKAADQGGGDGLHGSDPDGIDQQAHLAGRFANAVSGYLNAADYGRGRRNRGWRTHASRSALSEVGCLGPDCRGQANAQSIDRLIERIDVAVQPVESNFALSLVSLLRQLFGRSQQSTVVLVHRSVLHGWVLGVVIGDELDDGVAGVGQALKDPTKQSKWDSEDVAHVSRLRFLALGGLTKDRPINIRAQLLATDGSVSGPLDSWAVVSRHGAPLLPHARRAGGYSNGLSQ